MRWSCAESAFLVGPKKAFVASFYQHIHGQFFYSGGSMCTFVALGVLGHLCGVVGWEDSTGASSHVVTLVPVILWLDLHQQRIIHLQLQLVVMSGDKPVETDVVMWAIEGFWCGGWVAYTVYAAQTCFRLYVCFDIWFISREYFDKPDAG